MLQNNNSDKYRIDFDLIKCDSFVLDISMIWM